MVAIRIDHDGLLGDPPMIVQLHCKGPTGKVSRISAGGLFMVRGSKADKTV